MALTRLGTNAITTVPNSAITLDAAEIPNLDTAKITTGTMANARISEASVTQHVTETDLTPVRQDVLTLALKQAVQENSTKFNLPNSAITKFEADADFNLAGSTTTARHDDEYIYSATSSTGDGEFGTDANTMLYIDWNDSTTGIEGTETSYWTASTTHGSAALNSSTKKYGANSIYLPDPAAVKYVPTSSSIFHQAYSGDWTIEFWHKMTTRAGYGAILNKANHSSNVYDFRIYFSNSTGTTQTIYADAEFSGSGAVGINGGAMTDSTAWNHFVLTRDGSTMRLYVNGVQKGTVAVSGTLDADYADMRFAVSLIGSGTAYSNGYYDEARFSNICRYPNGTTFTPNSVTTIVTSATGTALGTTNVPTSAVTDVSGVMLMKNAYGTNTLGTVVKVYFTANNSAWTEAASYTDAGTFSTGIKMIKLGKTTCTSGSDVRWKIVWANQAASSKEAQIFGMGVNY